MHNANTRGMPGHHCDFGTVYIKTLIAAFSNLFYSSKVLLTPLAMGPNPFKVFILTLE